MTTWRKNYMTLQDVANALGITVDEVRAKCESREIPSIRIPATRIPRAAFEAYKAKRREDA